MMCLWHVSRDWGIGTGTVVMWARGISGIRSPSAEGPSEICCTSGTSVEIGELGTARFMGPWGLAAYVLERKQGVEENTDRRTTSHGHPSPNTWFPKRGRKHSRGAPKGATHTQRGRCVCRHQPTAKDMQYHSVLHVSSTQNRLRWSRSLTTVYDYNTKYQDTYSTN